MSIRRFAVGSSVVLAFVSVVIPARGAEPIANWPAPAYWDPGSFPGPEGPRRGMSTESGSIYSPLPFVGVSPCRIADTRGNGFTGAFGPPPLAAGSIRSFPIRGQCGIPIGAGAVSLNVTVTNTLGPGFLTVYPEGGVAPTVSTLNFVAGQTVANAAVVSIGTAGAIDFIAGVSGTDLIIDTNGFYGSPTGTDSNVFLGPGAGNASVTGGDNTAVGQNALAVVTSGAFNTALGHGALQNDTTGGANTGLGAGALFNTVAGSNNTAVGYQSLILNVGNDNTAVGYQAGFNNTTGAGNTAVGRGALFNNATGSFNIAIGWNAGVNTTGSNNILIGAGGVAGESNTIRIGDSSYHALYAAAIYGENVFPNGVQVLINSAGKLGTNTSSRRFKDDIRDLGAESDRLMDLRPVAFRYKLDFDSTGLTQYGLVAEEVEAVYPNLVAYDSDGQPLTVRYHLIGPLLLNEVQKQHRTLEAQQPEIDRLEKRLSNLEAQLAAGPQR